MLDGDVNADFASHIDRRLLRAFSNTLWRRHRPDSELQPMISPMLLQESGSELTSHAQLVTTRQVGRSALVSKLTCIPAGT